jgi:hypothetical protein
MNLWLSTRTWPLSAHRTPLGRSVTSDEAPDFQRIFDKADITGRKPLLASSTDRHAKSNASR